MPRARLSADDQFRGILANKQELYGDTSNEMVARRVDVSYNTVRNYKNDPENLPLKVLRKLAVVYHLSDEELIKIVRG